MSLAISYSASGTLSRVQALSNLPWLILLLAKTLRVISVYGVSTKFVTVSISNFLQVLKLKKYSFFRAAFILLPLWMRLSKFA